MLLDRRVQVEPAASHAVARHHASHRDDGHLRARPADIDDQMPDRFVDRQTGADRRRERLLDEGHLFPSAGRHGLFDGALLDLGALRRDADQDARLREPSRRHAAEHGGEVALGHLELGDRSLAQRSHGNDVAGIAADQIPGSLTDRDDGASVRVQRHDRRLVEDDPLALAVDDRVRRSEVDREVPPHQDPITQWPSPVASSSFFQIGTSCFSCSIPSRHASNASAR